MTENHNELHGDDDRAGDEATAVQTTVDGVSATEGTEARVSDATPKGDISDATPADRGDEDHDSTEPETFPAKVVKDLRKENARYRERARQADQLAERLHVALVAQTGKLADPTDLEFAEEHLDDPEALTAAVDELLERKPHLRARRVAGDVGQGQRGKTGGGVDLLEAMRGTL